MPRHRNVTIDNDTGAVSTSCLSGKTELGYLTVVAQVMVGQQQSFQQNLLGFYLGKGFIDALPSRVLPNQTGIQKGFQLLRFERLMQSIQLVNGRHRIE